MDAIPILTIEDVANIDAVLQDYLQKSESDLAVIIDKGGNVISQFGDHEVMDVTIIAALAAGSFAATKELSPAASARWSFNSSITRVAGAIFS